MSRNCIWHVGLAVAGALLLVSCKQANEPAPEVYEVALTRPMAVGDRYSVTSSAKLVSQGSAQAQGQFLGKGTLEAEVAIEVDAEVLEVDSSGLPTRLLFTVNSCSATVDGAASKCLEPGTNVEMRAFEEGEEPKLFPEDVDPDIQGLLAFLLAVYEPETPTDDRILAPKTDVKVGTRWEIDSELLKAVAGPEFSEAVVWGHGTLSGISNIHGMDHLLVDLEIEADGFRPPSEYGITAERTHAVVTARVFAPKDVTVKSHRLQFKVDFNGKLRDPDGVQYFTSNTVWSDERVKFPE